MSNVARIGETRIMYGCNVPLENKEIDKCKCVSCLSGRIDKVEKEKMNLGELIVNRFNYLESEINRQEKVIKQLCDKIAEIANFYYREKKECCNCCCRK